MFKINNKFDLYLIDIELDLLPDLLIVDNKLVAVLFLIEIVVFFTFDDVLDTFEKLVNNLLNGEIIFLVETKEEFKIKKLVELIVEIEEELLVVEVFVLVVKTEEFSMKEFEFVVLFSVIAGEFFFKVVEKVKIFFKLDAKWELNLDILGEDAVV